MMTSQVLWVVQKSVKSYGWMDAEETKDEAVARAAYDAAVKRNATCRLLKSTVEVVETFQPGPG